MPSGKKPGKNTQKIPKRARQPLLRSANNRAKSTAPAKKEQEKRPDDDKWRGGAVQKNANLVSTCGILIFLLRGSVEPRIPTLNAESAVPALKIDHFTMLRRYPSRKRCRSQSKSSKMTGRWVGRHRRSAVGQPKVNRRLGVRRPQVVHRAP